MRNQSTKARSILIGCAVALALSGAVPAAELDGPVTIVYDAYRVPTITGQSEHDVIFMQGYQHAQDRFWQMDFQRRLFSGRASELVGPAGLPQDVQLRTLGLRRAAERSLLVQSPEILNWLEAYSDGVNAWLADTSNPLPVEYGALELDRGGIPPWTPVDSLTVAKGLAFGLSFDLGDIDRTLALLSFRGVGEVLGFNGLQLFNNDLYPTKPFDPTVSIPGGSFSSGSPTAPPDEEYPAYVSDPNFAAMVQDYRDTIAQIPILENALDPSFDEQGSNWWVVSAGLSESGYAMLANDPHLSLGAPSTFYEIHLIVNGGMNVTGTSFPGAPGVVLGCNETICWGATVNALDVTDVYNEVLLPLDPSQPTTPTHTLFNGAPEPLQFIPQQFLVNITGNGIPNTVVDAGVPASQGGVTLIVPRRNNGPIVNISFDPTSPTPLTGLSVMYTGWSATRELETFRGFALASSMQEFKDALQYFDVGSQNWSYADIHGNIAYYTSAELPLREDLQNLFFPAGLVGPYLIRDGSHRSPHEWLPVTNPQPGQAIAYEILPFNEMPQVENPAQGYILNANNDPIGTTLDNVSWNQVRAGFNGLLYLAPGYAAGYRIGRIQRLFDDLLAGGGKVSQSEMVAVQANNQLLDAEVLAPYLIAAYGNATAPGADPALAALAADPRIAEAIGRLSAWDHSTPTGINQGFDPFDNPLAPGPPSAAEVEASIAATIYSTWRGQVVQRVIDGTLASLPIPLDAYAPGSDRAMIALRQFLDDYPVRGGTGVSLINFFTVPGVSNAFTARDIILLQSLHSALDLLASDAFANAFGNSTDQNDYRWGYLHRIVFSHFLGPALSIPPPGHPLNVSPALPGIARAGGMGAVDASSHSARADGVNEFMFGSGPSRRVVAVMKPTGPDVMEVIPGGESGLAGSPQQIDQLLLWLVNAYHPLPVSLADVVAIGVETRTYVCGDGVTGPGEQCDDGNANENDGCNSSCEIAPIITCLDPTVDADPQTCDADVTCTAVASCVDPLGGGVSVVCASSGPYGAGTTDVAVQCDGATQSTAATCPVTVDDVTPPTISVSVDPDSLWPPNHRMVNVDATVVATDTCGAVGVALTSIVSDEPDDAPGSGDGNTVNDIQQAAYGTADFAFDLRAERLGGGDGRVYTVTYTATDAGGNATSATATVAVAHDQGGSTEPLIMVLSQGAAGTTLDWTDPLDVRKYNVIRGDLEFLHDNGSAYDLGSVECIEVGSYDRSTSGGHEDATIPVRGQVFFYLVEYDDNGEPSSFGTESARRPRQPGAGGCD